jgi:hypothetical protein
LSVTSRNTHTTNLHQYQNHIAIKLSYSFTKEKHYVTSENILEQVRIGNYIALDVVAGDVAGGREMKPVTRGGRQQREDEAGPAWM